MENPQKKWIETEIDVETVDWKGEPLKVVNVKALKNSKTGAIRVYPFEIAKAEVKQIAECYGILPRDAAALMLMFSKPGPFKEGEVLYKYHLQKLLFYLSKYLETFGYGDSLPIDHFIKAKNGPVPENLNDDLQRFEKKGLIKIKLEKWRQGTSRPSKRITLTEEGTKIASALWNDLPNPYKEIAIKVKERIYPLDPESVRHVVHKEYPEYRDTYIENDIE